MLETMYKQKLKTYKINNYRNLEKCTSKKVPKIYFKKMWAMSTNYILKLIINNVSTENTLKYN